MSDDEIKAMIDFWGDTAEAFLEKKGVPEDDHDKSFKHALAAVAALACQLGPRQRKIGTPEEGAVILAILDQLWEACAKHLKSPAIIAGAVKVVVSNLSAVEIALLYQASSAKSQ
ncbi:MAG: hypothetical protein PHV78_00950 [Patescibacteria group bacterium]|nr:hypothetical protein [Patescibacteria group bacterium]MDD5121266.1 hypothetical protein [Patescibacteria group bacterium]MDD5222334.1 hypothetical protein [Patescibacteria group bacterium]MDD5395815.1 hypothetical protein [Patescibacteria group bacterium]